MATNFYSYTLITRANAITAVTTMPMRVSARVSVQVFHRGATENGAQQDHARFVYTPQLIGHVTRGGRTRARTYFSPYPQVRPWVQAALSGGVFHKHSQT